MDASESAALTPSSDRDQALDGSDRPRISPSENLRQLGMDCAAMIQADAPSWADAAQWLQMLPICQSTVERRHEVDTTDDVGELLLVIGLDGRPVDAATPPSQRFNVYDGEAEANRIHGPMLRRLLNGWSAATYRFLHQEQGDDRYFDFGIDDSRRITLLAALTFNRDFDGEANGLGWPWEHPHDCQATFEGRGWTWSLLTSGLFAERNLVDMIGVATKYLWRMTGDGSSEQHPAMRLFDALAPSAELAAVIEQRGLDAGVARKARTPAEWDFLQAAAEAGEPLLGNDLAGKAGYSDYKGPCGKLVRRGDLTKPSDRGGYEITGDGRRALEKRLSKP
ncbi:MAG: hypothetical protein IID31_03575 [Planctomycetes bacterium]|nr:hypothetical protein [Planctomycetota bacterium]